MKTTVFETYELLSIHAAQEICKLIRQKPDALLCLAAGHTSLGIFDQMERLYKQGQADFSQVKIVGLDEWLGLGRQDEGCCTHFMYRNCFDRLNLKEENIRMFDGRCADPELECRQISDYISNQGGIDYMLLGMGMNGHLALNEPGVSFDSRCHVVDLDEVTKVVGQKYFRNGAKLEKGITLGILDILQAKRVVLAVNGEKKAGIVKKLVESKVDNSLPATILKVMDNSALYLDASAASGILAE